jgi:hypothetical protein
MGISLNGLTPAGTYPGLIKTGDNTAISGTPKVLSDGNGNNLPMEVSTTGVNFTNQLQQGGVAVPTQANLAAKQDTLVSGTNIKTINGASLLGSGNIPVVTSPSGVAGAIQFSNGSAFASDAANLFWDDTNNRLGVGTNTPSTALDISASLTSILTLRNGGTNFITTRTSGIGESDIGLRIWNNANNFTLDLYGSGTYDSSKHRFCVGGGSFERLLIGATTAARITGSGSTSATTSLLVQNSAGTSNLAVRDNGSILINGLGGAGGASGGTNFESNGNDMSFKCAYYYRFFTSDNKIVFGTSWDGVSRTYAYNENKTIIGSNAVPNTSAQFQVDSTTTGILPPRMTTTQKNAIASPAAGLVVYDSTTNKLCCYNGSTWNDLF